MSETTSTTTPVGPSEAANELTEAAASAAAVGKPRSLLSDAWHDLRRRPLFLVSAALILFLAFVALFPGVFTSQDPRACPLANSLEGSSAQHIMGRDLQGCDIYARVLYGTRPSILVGIIITLGCLLIGGFVGAVAGFYGGIVDSLLSRLTDIFFAIPLLLGSIVFLSAFRDHRNLLTVCTAIAVLGWTQIARIMRGAVISVKETDFIVAARALGASNSRILLRHIIPNALAPVIVVATLSLGTFIVAGATLSFLGIGLPDTTISWGGDISSAQTSLRAAPHVLLWPSAALSITVLSFIMLGDAVRDALDPKLR